MVSIIVRRLSLLSLVVCLQAHAAPVITVYTDGYLQWTNSVSNGYYRLEWSPDLTDTNGGWTGTWSNNVTIAGGSNRTFSVDTPRYYRLYWDTNAFAEDSDNTIGTNETTYTIAGNGRLTLTNLAIDCQYAVDWLSGTNWVFEGSNWVVRGTNWYRTWQPFCNIPATGLQHAVFVPRGYRLRVLSTNVPPAVSGMSWIFQGTFAMGHPAAPRTVYVDGFYMDHYEVTQAQWEEVYQWAVTNGYDLPDQIDEAVGTNYPIAAVSWYDAIKYCNARSEQAGLDPYYYLDAVHSNVYRAGTCDVSVALCDTNAAGFRLPTEAQWERAARGFIAGGHFSWGGASDTNVTWKQANYRNSDDLSEYMPRRITPVGGHMEVASYFANMPGFGTTNRVSFWQTRVNRYPANEYGLYDMSGNVWEWCWDWHQYDLTNGVPATNPTGPASGSRRALRGGSYGNDAADCTVYSRGFARPGDALRCVGFRCARGRE